MSTATPSLSVYHASGRSEKALLSLSHTFPCLKFETGKGSTQFAFDDAADVYYYETKGWIAS
jgi:hypothetical protein